MVLPASHGISRVPWYSGSMQGRVISFVYGAVTLFGASSQKLRLDMAFVTPRAFRKTLKHCPTTPILQRLRAITQFGFGLFPFRSPLLGESCLLSFPVGTEMFHFPTLASLCLCVQQRMTSYLNSTGFPIRKSPDQSLFSDSPRLIAAIHVLLRRLVPRHSPFALSSLIRLFSFPILSTRVSQTPSLNDAQAVG
jgi:hypothetical protein